jgi:hypothetical protein
MLIRKFYAKSESPVTVYFIQFENHWCFYANYSEFCFSCDLICIYLHTGMHELYFQRNKSNLGHIS